VVKKGFAWISAQASVEFGVRETQKPEGFGVERAPEIGLGWVTRHVNNSFTARLVP
jgi:hypothetical protein